MECQVLLKFQRQVSYKFQQHLAFFPELASLRLVSDAHLETAERPSRNRGKVRVKQCHFYQPWLGNGKHTIYQDGD